MRMGETVTIGESVYRVVCGTYPGHAKVHWTHGIRDLPQAVHYLICLLEALYEST